MGRKNLFATKRIKKNKTIKSTPPKFRDFKIKATKPKVKTVKKSKFDTDMVRKFVEGDDAYLLFLEFCQEFKGSPYIPKINSFKLDKNEGDASLRIESLTDLFTDSGDVTNFNNQVSVDPTFLGYITIIAAWLDTDDLPPQSDIDAAKVILDEAVDNNKVTITDELINMIAMLHNTVQGTPYALELLADNFMLRIVNSSTEVLVLNDMIK